MLHESGWEDIAQALEKSKTVVPLRADWYAFVGSEDYGIWLLRPEGSKTEQIRATFGLIVARGIEKLGIPPVPVPMPLQHCPHWTEYLVVEEDLERQIGHVRGRSDWIPHGLGAVDWDAVDLCTRAWLELLRRDSLAFRVKAHGTEMIKGIPHAALNGTIGDLWGASIAYCKRRARDEIAARLASPLMPEKDRDRGTDDNALSPPAPRRGPRRDPQRREGIRKALGKYGDSWRDHLAEIFEELDSNEVSLGKNYGMRIDLGDGSSHPVSKWEDLDLAQGEDRARIIDTLRKYRN